MSGQQADIEVLKRRAPFSPNVFIVEDGPPPLIKKRGITREKDKLYI